MTILPYDARYRDDMIYMVLQAKDALGRVPRLNEDLLDIRAHYLERGGGFFLALDDTARVIGCGGWSRVPDTNEAFLHRLYVKAARKRSGIGTKLLETLEADMRQHGVTLARVHLGAPREQWLESYAFYPKHGYRADAERYMKKELSCLSPGNGPDPPPSGNPGLELPRTIWYHGGRKPASYPRSSKGGNLA